MMINPDQLMNVFSQPDKSQPHQWRFGEHEASFALFVEKRREPRLLLRRKHFAPVVTPDRQSHSLVHHLKRMIQIFPIKGGAQNRMTIYDFLPCSFEGRNIYFSAEGNAVLVAIHCRIRGVEGMKEQPLLH